MSKSRALTEKVEIVLLTLPDGSQRRVLSRPVGDPEAIYNWIIAEGSDNPRRWLDHHDLYRCVYLGECPRMTAEILKRLRTFFKGAQRWAIAHGDCISTKEDGRRAVTKFKMWTRKSPSEKLGHMQRAARELGLKLALDKRVNRQCETLGTDEIQLDAIRQERRRRHAANQGVLL